MKITPYVSNKLPVTNQLVMLKIKGRSQFKIGYWDGGYWCYITNAPVTAFCQDNVEGWVDIPEIPLT